MKKIFILLTLTNLILNLPIKGQNCHIYAMKAIKYKKFVSAPMGNVTAYKVKIMPCIDDSIQLKRIWIGNSRYSFFGLEQGITVFNKKNPSIELPELKIVIASKDSKRFYQKVEKKYMPPFKYDGAGLVEYSYNGKTQYYTIPFWTEYQWTWPSGQSRGIPISQNVLDPQYQFVYKQQ